MVTPTTEKDNKTTKANCSFCCEASPHRYSAPSSYGTAQVSRPIYLLRLGTPLRGMAFSKDSTLNCWAGRGNATGQHLISGCNFGVAAIH